MWVCLSALRTVLPVSRIVLIVQHGEKERLPGDPGLTPLGHAQAMTTAVWLDHAVSPVAIWSSPARRAIETVAPILARTGRDLTTDDRLRERMDWDGDDGKTLGAFLRDWQLASADRTYTPRSGVSSNEAASRFLAAVADLTSTFDDGVAVVVAHGGVTVDVLRTLLGDERVTAETPGLIEDGVPCCAITILRLDGDRWCVDSFPTTSHLAAKLLARRST